MRAVRIPGARTVETRDCPDPAPEGDEVVVRIEAAAICGSDLHGLYERPGEKPCIPGHEAAGVVVAVDRPKHTRVGDRVCASAFNSCGRCDLCRAGYVAYCRAKTGVHGFSRDGFQAELARIPEASLLPLPEGVSFEAGCLILDPVGTPYHALRRMGTDATHVVGVFGLGPMGLGAVLVAAHLGARVIGVDPIAFRRNLARTLGAEETLDPADGDVVARLRDLTGGDGLDRALECSGKPGPLHAALDLARPLGHVAIIGENAEAVVRPSQHFIHKELTLSGSCCFPLGEYGEILRMVRAGLKAERLITHRFPLERAAQAYAAFAAGDTGKVVFLPTSAGDGRLP